MRFAASILGLVLVAAAGCVSPGGAPPFPPQEGYLYWMDYDKEPPELMVKTLTTPKEIEIDPETPLANVLVYFEVSGPTSTFGTAEQAMVKHYFTFTDRDGHFSIRAIRPPLGAGGTYQATPPTLHVIAPTFEKVTLPWSATPHEVEMKKGDNLESEVPALRKLFSLHAVALESGDRARLGYIFKAVTDPEGFESEEPLPLNRAVPTQSYRDDRR